MEYEVIIVRSALNDLEKIHDYIALENRPAAQSFGSKLLNEALSLNVFPERGGFIAERAGLRFVVVRPYLVVYRIVTKTKIVRVLRFWHGSRERGRMRI